MNQINRNIELILASLGFILVICYYLIFGVDGKIFLGLLGTIATLFFGSIKYRIENDKLFKELFQEFNSRYDLRFNDLINELKYDNGRKLTKDERNLIIDYLNLCSEEYLWRSRNRIPKKVWNSWKAGIKENLCIKQVEEIYKKEISSINGRISFYGLDEELKK
jgi:hypothetical protein